MDSAEIRRRWLRFFTERDHALVPSASLISDDPTTLFTIAGMAPFKPYFQGVAPAPWPRATSVQKCVRFPDIDEVGRTTRHASFFQMCGNFSFGDYFKERAIPLAWELLTTSIADGGYGFDPARLWVTVYRDDDEAAQIWQRVVGVPTHRIQRRGMADNFWSMGVPGPCGPCSEIYFDRGPAYGREGGPVVDEERYLEIWNLVFMQYLRGEGVGKDDFPILGELPARNIDTGLGLERTAMLLQGVDNLYEIDTTRAILDRASALTGVRYGADSRTDVSLRVVADHSRTAAMLIGDGVRASNEGRGYVLRRVVRRVVRNMRLLGARDPSMSALASVTVSAMAPQYPELEQERQRIEQALAAEETSFLETLRTGTQIFDMAVMEVRRTGASQLAGEKAFTLHDTYGFPIDLTLEMAAEQGLTVDVPGFHRLMDEQRQRAKADSREKKAGAVDLGDYQAVRERSGPTEFTGYSTVRGEATVVGIIRNGRETPSAGSTDEVEIVLSRTPFYAEGGGQLADQGTLRIDDAVVEVVDVQRRLPDLIVHRAKIVAGEVRQGASAYAEVDIDRRRAISRAHTATHLVHAGIRKALGDDASQAGSENAPGRFRFDFHANSAVPESVLRDVEAEVNAVLLDDAEVHAFLTSLDEAREMGALAYFGDKYGNEVRVVEVGDYSRELCGGTHAARAGQLGVVTILGESSIGQGVRRVEALVGADAYRFLAREHVIVNRLTDLVKTSGEELPERIEAMLGRLRDAERELEKMRAAGTLELAPSLASNATDVQGTLVVAHEAPKGTVADDLRKLALDVRGRMPADRPVLVVVGAVNNDRPALVVVANDAAQARGLKAGDFVRTLTPLLGGGGGGRDDVAQGGGSNADALPAALSSVREQVAKRLPPTG